MPSSIACIFIMYSVLLVIIMKLDQHDDRKSDIVRLVDNCPFDRQKYYVSLETGFRKGAGTTAQVSCLYTVLFTLRYCCYHRKCLSLGSMRPWTVKGSHELWRCQVQRPAEISQREVFHVGAFKHRS